MKRCQVCGKEIPDGSKFCQFCGSEQVEQSHTFEEKMSKDQGHNAPKKPDPQMEEIMNMSGKTLAKNIFKTIVGMILVVVIGLILWGFFFGDGDSDESADGNLTPTTNSQVSSSAGISNETNGNQRYTLDVEPVMPDGALPESDDPNSYHRPDKITPNIINATSKEVFDYLWQKNERIDDGSLVEGDWYSSDGTCEFHISNDTTKYESNVESSIYFSWIGDQNGGFDYSLTSVTGNNDMPFPSYQDDYGNVDLSFVTATQSRDVIIVRIVPIAESKDGMLPQYIIMYKDLI